MAPDWQDRQEGKAMTEHARSANHIYIDPGKRIPRRVFDLTCNNPFLREKERTIK